MPYFLKEETEARKRSHVKGPGNLGPESTAAPVVLLQPVFLQGPEAAS